MSIIIVSPNLNIINEPISVQIYNTVGLSYGLINGVYGALSYKISDDRKTAYIHPAAQVGNVTLKVTTDQFGDTEVPVYFGNEYEKGDLFFSPEQDFYGQGYFNEEGVHAKYSNTVNYVYDDIVRPIMSDPSKIISISKYKNVTFPEYCSTNVIGIAFSLAAQQFYEVQDQSSYEYCVVFGINAYNAPIPDTASFISECTPIFNSPLSNNKYLEFTDNDSGIYYAAKYGAFSPDFPVITDAYTYCSRYKAIKIAAIYSGEDKFIFQNWRETQGVPVAMEVLYQKQSFSTPLNLNSFVIPSASRVPFNLYDPVSWISNVSNFIDVILIKFDGKDFHVALPGNPGVFTWGSSKWGELIGIGTWGA